MSEYVTFTTTTSTGEEVEMAVVEEFEFDKKNYIAASLVNNDEIDADNVFLYRVEMKGDDFKPLKITNKFEYREVCEAYLAMQEEEVTHEE